MSADYKKAAAKAGEVLKTYKISKPPINPEAIAEAMGVSVVYAKFIPEIIENVSGFIRLNHDSSDAPKIVVNKEMNPSRKIFTIAHELGHYLLHGKQGEYARDDACYQVMPRNNAYPEGKPKEEQEADCFAANLLVPENMLRTYESYMGLSSLATIFAASADVILNRKKFLGI